MRRRDLEANCVERVMNLTEAPYASVFDEGCATSNGNRVSAFADAGRITT